MAYMKRTGVTSLIHFIHLICRVIDVYYAPISGWVSLASITSDQKAAIMVWINSAQTVCSLIKLIPDD
jgi:hypothetical protein